MFLFESGMNIFSSKIKRWEMGIIKNGRNRPGEIWDSWEHGNWCEVMNVRMELMCYEVSTWKFYTEYGTRANKIVDIAIQLFLHMVSSRCRYVDDGLLYFEHWHQGIRLQVHIVPDFSVVDVTRTFFALPFFSVNFVFNDNLPCCECCDLLIIFYHSYTA